VKQTVSFRCYSAPGPVMNVTAEAVAQVLSDARGYFKTRGFTVKQIGLLLQWSPTRQQVCAALSQLKKAGRAEKTSFGGWRKGAGRG
jgi:hypothetical protein